MTQADLGRDLTKAKIVIVYNTAWYVYILRKRLIEAMVERGWDVTVVSPVDDYVDRIRALGCKHMSWSLSRAGMQPLEEGRSLIALGRLIRILKPTVVLTYTTKPNIYGALIGRLLGIPIVCNVAGLGHAFANRSIRTYLATYLYRYAFKSAFRVFFQNPDDKAHFEMHKLIDPGRAVLLPGSGVDLGAFQPREQSQSTVKFVFLLVARLLREKGIEEFVAAARAIRAQSPDCEFWLIGAMDQGNPSCIEQSLVDSWVAEGLVRYFGYVDNVKDYYGRATCAVLPSYYREGVPKSLLEALASGLPVITTDAPGCREVVDDGVNGYLCVPRDTGSLLEKLQLMLGLDREHLRAMGRASRIKAETKFDEAVVINAYLGAIDLAISRQAR